ncbi:MAG: capsular polysaccharide synthesis protein [Deltaproteobacteria bacterium]|jgi:hypothetical protein|nr:capsular polysaccharide synthesis protein [Deltaproteobacteria bacterium]
METTPPLFLSQCISQELAQRKRQEIDPETSIFCFWHDIASLPGYIRLCMETWKKFYPNFAVILLDYKSLHQYLPMTCFSKEFLSHFGFAQQSDVFRVFLLKHYGGYWLDCDTIVTRKNFFFEKKHDQMLYAVGEKESLYTGIVYANNSIIIDDLCTEIDCRYALFHYFLQMRSIFDMQKVQFAAFDAVYKNLLVEIAGWDYFSNAIWNPLLVAHQDRYVYFHPKETGTILESVYNEERARPLPLGDDLYRDFYFRRDFDPLWLDKCDGLIALHNSWTPDKYKKMGVAEFIEQDLALAKLLRRVLSRV